MSRFVSLLGVVTILAIAYALSKNRKFVPWRTVAWRLGLRFLVALFVLRTQPDYWLPDKISAGVARVLNYSFAGSS